MLPVRTTTAAEALKQQTAEAHRKAEEVLMPQLSAIRSEEEYAALLKMYYGFYRPMGDILSVYMTPAILPDAKQRTLWPLLVDDLTALGIELSGVPLCNNLPVLDSVAKSFGAMYVLEGSTLGGRVIAKMLSKKEGVMPLSLRFFEGYGSETKTKWKAFVDTLNDQNGTEKIVEGATETFESMTAWMRLCFAGR